jgi:hypothetical protein
MTDSSSQIDYRSNPSASSDGPGEGCPDYDHPIPAPEFHQPPPQDTQTEMDYDEPQDHNQMQLGMEIPTKGYSPESELILQWERGERPR